MSDEEEVSSVSDDGSDVSTEMSPGLRRLLDAVIDKSDPDALQKLLAKRQEELDRCLGSVLMDEDLPVDEKVKSAKLLLQAGASPDTRTSEQEPLLCRSVNTEDHKMTTLLLNSGVNVNAADKKGLTALHFAARKGLQDIARLLLAKGANINAVDEEGWIPIFHAMAKYKWATVEFLLPDSNTSVMSKRRETALQIAIGYRYFDGLQRPKGILEKLIEKGASLNECSCFYSPLSLSCMFADLDATRALIKAGCDVDISDSENRKILNEVAEMRFHDSEMPHIHELMTNMAEVLIEAGADVDGADSVDRTPLMEAVIACNYSMVRLFLQANCNMEMLDEDCDLCQTLERDDIFKEFLRDSKGYTDCATYVMVDACCAEDDQEIQRLYFQCFQENKELVDDLGVQLEHPPISLYRLCRVAVRSSLPTGRAFPKAVEQLPLPPHVKDFVAFKTN